MTHLPSFAPVTEGQHPLRTTVTQPLKRLLTLGAIGLISISLVACNGSSSSQSDSANNNTPSENTNEPVVDNDDSSDTANPPSAVEKSAVTGTAAIGAAIANTPVEALCQDGKGFEQAVTTDEQGRYTGFILKASFPCGFRITHNETQETYYSYAADSDQTHVNLTPLTTLLVARASSQLPDDWYQQAKAASGTSIQIQADLLTQAVATIESELQSQTSGQAPNGSPITTPFEIGDAFDRILDRLAETMQASQTSFDTLLQGYRDGNSLNALGVNLGTIVIDDSIKDDDVPSGQYTLTVTTSVMGSGTSVVLHNMPKPANQSEFCNIQSDELAEQGYQINSCSFDGQVGVIDSTLSVSGMTLQYQTHYEYTPA